MEEQEIYLEYHKSIPINSFGIRKCDNLKSFISEVGGESETNETNLVGCQRCLQMPWAAGRVRIANVDMPLLLSREENMQNEMKTPTYGLGGE